MREFEHQKFVWLAAGVLAGMAALFWMYHSSNTPEPTRSTHRIEAGGVAQAMATPKRSGIRSRRNPRYLEYESAGGEVSVYVVRGTFGYRAADREQMQKLTDDFAAGQAPQEYVARSRGSRGRINLGGGWQRHHEASYLVLIRSANESEVTLVVHYGP
jgi:hypothetical protein